LAKGEIIVRIDGHTIVAQDFLRCNVKLMNEHPEAWSTGGPIVHLAKTNFGKAVAVAMSHKLGVGNASHHFLNYEGYGEGVPFPAIRRWVFDRVGNFDESLVRNQDDEFNFRMTKAGGKVFISPKVKYTYFVRENIRQLFRQYFQYGFWRIPVIKKHKQPTTLRQTIPMLFYLGSFLLFLISIVLKQLIIAFALPLVYFFALLVCAIQVLPNVGVKIACRVPLAIATLHTGYAFGMMYGFWSSVFNRDAWNVSGRVSSLSR
jgi:GT2 family glycosyltransferase